MPDKGIVCRQSYGGKADVLGIRLNWEKRYITLGPVATLLGLAFHLYDPDHLLGDTQDIGITLALIPTHTPGIEIGTRHFPMNQVLHERSEPRHGCLHPDGLGHRRRSLRRQGVAHADELPLRRARHFPAGA